MARDLTPTLIGAKGLATIHAEQQNIVFELADDSGITHLDEYSGMLSNTP